MGSLSNYGENAVIGHMCGTAYSPVATVYLALATSDPGETATGASMNEVANSGSYARTAISFSAAASRRVTQTGAVTFPQATGSWGTVSHWAIVDSATYGAGNVLASGAFGTSKAIVSGNTPSVATTVIYVEITASTGMTNYFVLAFLNLMFRNTAFTQPATYLALSTTAPADDGSSITEPSGSGYARLLVNKAGGSTPNWNTVSSGATDNEDVLTMASATGSWGTIDYAVWFDASTSGNALAYGNVTNQAVGDGDTVSVAAGAADWSQS